MNIGILMPGQGSQRLGMGLDFYHRSDKSKDIFDRSMKLLDWDLNNLIKEGPIEDLSNTKYCQPAVYVVSCAIAAHFFGFPDIAAVAGHSLGQFAAAFLSGCFEFEDGLKLVSERARIMGKYSADGKYGMSAVLGLSARQVKEIVSGFNDLYCANFNSNQQTVVSGPVARLRESADAFIKKGAKRVVELDVSGAFHSPYMSEANEEFAEILKKINFKKPSIPLISNKDGNLLTGADAVKIEFLNAMVNHVDWISVINKMTHLSVEKLIEVGPGNVLTGLSKRINSDFIFQNIDTFEDLKFFSSEVNYAFT